MDTDKYVEAVFGTTLFTSVSGSGTVQISPPGGVYPYASVVRLTGIPDAGNYFGFWGNAATGNTNPLYFAISSPTQTVSSVFGPVPSGQAALTILINGQGRVEVAPRANAYPTNQSVTLTATPDAGQSFIDWSGDAGGTQNPLTVSMIQSKTVTANFSSRSLLRTDRAGLEGWRPNGFRFTVVGYLLSSSEIFASTNLNSWTSIGTVTNIFGEVQFMDPNAYNFQQRFYRSLP
jgi:hypothetical protein